MGNTAGNRGAGGGNRVAPPQWRDEKFPVIGQRLDTSSGRIDYNFDLLTVDYQDNARYTDEFIGFACQLNHEWELESVVRPHVHWQQRQAGAPNILLSYIMYKNGAAIPTSWTLLPLTTHLFTYTSGTIAQISKSAEIDTTGLDGVSSWLKFKLYRDSANASTLFAGADSYTGNWEVDEFDVHVKVDAAGSVEEYSKF